MTHKTRAEQRGFKVRKDPHKLARPTRIHRVVSDDDAKLIDESVAEGIAEYEEAKHGEAQSAD